MNVFESRMSVVNVALLLSEAGYTLVRVIVINQRSLARGRFSLTDFSTYEIATI